MLRAKSQAIDILRASSSPLTFSGTILIFSLSGCGGIPRVSVDVDGESVTTEDGGSVELTIALAHMPSGVITVAATSSDEGEALASEPVRFDARNWRQPQIIRITGQDDTLDDGDAPFEVTITATNARHPERPLVIDVLSFLNRDDEVARFEAIGDLLGGDYASFVTDVSATGEVVVGWSVGASGEQAVRFTREDGLQGLGGAESRAESVSPNGELIAGSVLDPAYYSGRDAALFLGDGSYRVLEAQKLFPGSPDYAFALRSGNVVLDDGRVFATCYQYGVYFAIGCRYDAPERVQPISEPFAADSANNVAGRRNPNRYDPNTYLVYNNTTIPYTSPACRPPFWECVGQPRDFSEGGAVVVGTSRVPAAGIGAYDPPGPVFETGWFFTASGGSERLSDLEGGSEETGAYAVSSDGRVIAGFGTDDEGKTAVVWLEGVPIVVADVVREQGGALPEGFRLLEVRALSADTLTLAGNGVNADGNPEGFRVALASAL